MKNNRKRKFYIFIVLLVIFTIISPYIHKLSGDMVTFQDRNKLLDLEIADIAGTDLYAEQISAYVASNKSIITQSLFTNDTNIFPHFDSKDPAFEKCNLLISASNGIVSRIFPTVLTGNTLSTPPDSNFNGFTGFLYYDNSSSVSTVNNKAIRALEIIKRKFQLELIMVNTTDPYFFPFVGYSPNWETYFDEIIPHLPNDGYWQALNVDRLISDSYYENYHLSSSILMINSLDFVEILSNLPTDQLDFNIDLSFMGGFEIDELFESLNISISSEDLSSNSHFTTLTVQYEGSNNGIENIGPNQYKFDLWKSMEYYGVPLRPSEKIFITIIGIFMSGIDINILGTEIYDTSPKYFDFDAETLDRISSILSLLDIDIDLEILEQITWELVWVNEYGTYRSYTRPIVINWNIADPEQFLLHTLTDLTLKNGGYQGLSTIPTGMLEEINNFIVSYNISNSEPNIRITRKLIGENASFGIDRDEFNFTINVENIGNTTVWGVPYSYATPPNPDNLGSLENLLFGILFDIPTNPNPDLYERIKTLVENNCSQLVDDYTNYNDEVRVFEVDSLGTGTVDYYYPWNPLNADALDQIPYSPELAQMMRDDGGFTSTEIGYFENQDSIRNPDNWKLNPGEGFSYNISTSVTTSDSYSAFHTSNFTYNASVPLSPQINNGTEILNTNASMSLQADNRSWIIQSENQTLDVHYLEVDFIFQNSTALDLINYSIDRILILINFTQNVTVLNTLNGTIYNHTLGGYQNVTATRLNVTWRFSLINRNNSLFDDIFDPTSPNNYTVRFRLNGSSSEPFNTSINDINIEYQIRDLNSVTRQGAQILFGPESRISQLSRRSSSHTLGTDNIASISTTANLTSYNLTLGEINTYTLKLKSFGSLNAENISISIALPGILNERNNFTFGNNTLTYSKRYLNVSEELTLSFSYFTPNSGQVDVSVTYDSPETHPLSNASRLIATPNEVYFSAPVDYEFRLPFLRSFEVFYNTTSLTPDINEEFNLTVNIKNNSPNLMAIPDLQFEMDDSYGGLIRTDNNRSLNFTNIAYNEIISFNITLNKTSWRAYYYPAINFFQGSESSTIQISISLDYIFGNLSFILTKTVNRDQIEVGDQIIISISLKNTGTIKAENLVINDMVCYSGTDFSLISGKLINKIDSISPGQIITINYIIQAKKQNSVILKNAVVDYYFLMKLTVESDNTINIKIVIPIEEQMMYILIPSFLALGIILIFLWQTNKYRGKKFEMQRHELVVFELSSRDSIIKIENTLRERLNILSKENGFSKIEKESITKQNPIKKKKIITKNGKNKK